MAITPRHYLDFINHYADLFHEKRSELEEQQMHLNVGLRKIDPHSPAFGNLSPWKVEVLKSPSGEIGIKFLLMLCLVALS